MIADVTKALVASAKSGGISVTVSTDARAPVSGARTKRLADVGVIVTRTNIGTPASRAAWSGSRPASTVVVKLAQLKANLVKSKLVS